MKVTETDLSDAKLIAIEGSATIDEIEAIACELRDLATRSEGPVVLSLEDVARSDASFLQLLAAFRISLRSRGRGISMRPLAPDHPVVSSCRHLGIALGDIGDSPGGTE